MPDAPPGYPSHFARLQHVLELRREGKTYQEIADRAGLKSPGQAQALVSRAIKRILRETAEEIRSVELSRLEVLIQCLWDKGIKDAEVGDFARFDRIKQLLEAKLKWCGATAAIENQTDNRISIVINKFTPAEPAKPLAPTLQQIELMTEPEKVGA